MQNNFEEEFYADAETLLKDLEPKKDAPIDKPQSETPHTYTGAELYKLHSDQIPCLIEPIVPAVGVVALVGGSDTGKSMFLRQTVLSVVSEENFLSFKINAVHKKAIFVATEDDTLSTSFLIRKQAKSIKDLDRIRFYFETENIPKYLDDQLTAEPADVVVIDAWSDVFGQNLNDSALIRGVLNVYRSLANKHNCLIFFLHHTGKRTQKLVPSKDNILSGQGFEAKMRLVMELRNDIEDENFKNLCIVKGNYLGKEYKNSSYKLFLDPDNFRFSDTGERIPFDELATLTDTGKTIKAPLKKAEEVDQLTHSNLCKSIFTPTSKLKLSELKTRLSNKYSAAFGTTFSEDRTKKYIDYLMHDLGILQKEGKDRSPSAHYFLVTSGCTVSSTE